MTETASSPVQTAIDALAAVARGLTGVRTGQVYAEPPDALNVWPAVVCYAGGGTMRLIRAPRTGDRHTLVVEFITGRDDISRAVAELMPFIDPFVAALRAEPTLGGKVTAITETTYELDWEQYNAVGVLVLRFNIECSMHQE